METDGRTEPGLRICYKHTLECCSLKNIGTIRGISFQPVRFLNFTLWKPMPLLFRLNCLAFKRLLITIRN